MHDNGFVRELLRVVYEERLAALVRRARGAGSRGALSTILPVKFTSSMK